MIDTDNATAEYVEFSFKRRGMIKDTDNSTDILDENGLWG